MNDSRHGSESGSGLLYPFLPSWLTEDERQLGEWAIETPDDRLPGEFWRYVRDQIPSLLNTIAAFRQAHNIVPDHEGLASRYDD